MRASTLAITLSLAVALPATAETGTLDQAIRFYNDGSLAAAVPLLDLIVRDNAQPGSIRALAGIYLGLAKVRLGDRAGASEALLTAFEGAPDMQLPPGTPPDAAQFAEEQRAAVRGAAAPAILAPPAAPAPTSAPTTMTPPPPSEKKAAAAKGAEQPAPAAQERFLLGADMRFYDLPTDKYGGPAIDLLVGKIMHNARIAGVFGVLFGVHNSYLFGCRADFASIPRPFSFGAGFDVNIIYQPAEPSDLPPMLLQGMVNLFNVAFQWKSLLIEVRTISLGGVIRVSVEQPLARFMLDTGVSIMWVPGR